VQKKLTKIGINILKISLAVGIIAWMIHSGAIDLKVFHSFFSVQNLVTSFFGVVVAFVMSTVRWKLLLKVHDIKISFQNCWQLNLIGLFFNYVVPGGVGGDVIKGFYIVKENPGKRMGAGMSVLMDRVLGLYALVILCMIFLVVDWTRIQENEQLIMIGHSIVMVFVLFTLGLVLAFSDHFRNLGWQKFFHKFSIGHKLLLAYEAVHAYGKALREVYLTIAISLGAQLVIVLTHIFVGKATGFVVPWEAYLFVLPLGFMVTAVPISPAGVGVGQMAFYFLFNLYLGEKSQIGPTLATIFQVLQFLLSVFGAYYFIRRKAEIRESHVAS
jgi:uncharacterized protein (TIRG00374 family)